MGEKEKIAISGDFKKVKLKVCAELWIDPVDFLPLSVRERILRVGKQPEWFVNFASCGIDLAAKEAVPRFFLGILSKELARALKNANKEISEPDCWDRLVDESLSGEKKLDRTRNINGEINSEGTSFNVSLNIEESSKYEKYRILKFQGKSHQEQLILPTFSSPAQTSYEQDANLTVEENVLSGDQQEQYPNLRSKISVADGESLQKLPESQSPNVIDNLHDSAIPSVSTIIKREPCDEDFDDKVLHYSDKIQGKNGEKKGTAESHKEMRQMDDLFKIPCIDSGLLACGIAVKDEPSEGNEVAIDNKVKLFEQRSICQPEIVLPSEGKNGEKKGMVDSHIEMRRTDDRFRISLIDSGLLACGTTVKDEPLEGNEVAITNGVKLVEQRSISQTEIDLPSDVPGTLRDNNILSRMMEASDVSEAKVFENVMEFSTSSGEQINGILHGESVRGYLKDFICNANFIYSGNPFSSMEEFQVKNEVDETLTDALDLMPLSERVKLLAAENVRFQQRTQEHGGKESDPDGSGFSFQTSARRRKRKKTATDSVEVALEEDAPGLLQGLLDKGIHPDEIRLYGCEEDNEILDCASNCSSFEDLENVIYKIFTERSHSLGKLNLKRSWKGEKASYCLTCLISLIEQTRYLQFRKYPVEWGWCRDLQSFIFVFEMHNRIVLERPEYGYATYFFELVASHAIDWQIRRLIIAMKLPSCSRTTLMENRPLLVGADVSEGEACVLEEYGWVRNCGLGTMLNYCDRVVHDRCNERSISDWRLKIGKLLMNGYDRGRTVHAGNDKHTLDQCIEVKLGT